MQVEERFLEHVRRECLLPEGLRVVIGCSGGADSVALLHMVARTREALGLAAVGVAHLDHALRDASSDDAAFVRSLAGSVGLAFHEARERPTAEAGESPEQAARRLRYGFLGTVAREHGASAVLVAHHLDDQAETVLYRALTGTGLRGLAAMPASRVLSPEPPTVRLVRPLLPFRRAELRSWLTEQGLSWREDPTNAAGNVRARLRNEAFPVLAACVGRDPAPLLARLASHAAEAVAERVGGDSEVAARFVEESEDRVHFRAGFVDLPVAVVKRTLAATVQRVRGDAHPPTEAEVLRLLDLFLGNGSESVRGIEVLLGPAGPTITRRSPVSPSEPFSLAVRFGAPLATPGGGEVRFERRPADPATFLERLRDGSGRTELLDADRLEGPLVLRSWDHDERFVPLGGREPVRVRTYLARRDVPAATRPGVAVLADDDGPVWVVGHGIADRVKVRPETRELVLARLRTG